jgi:hypothetical protein
MWSMRGQADEGLPLSEWRRVEIGGKWQLGCRTPSAGTREMGILEEGVGF